MLVTLTGRVTNAREIKVTEQTTSVIAEKNETHGRLAHDGLALSTKCFIPLNPIVKYSLHLTKISILK